MPKESQIWSTRVAMRSNSAEIMFVENLFRDYCAARALKMHRMSKPHKKSLRRGPKKRVLPFDKAIARLFSSFTHRWAV